MEGGCLAESCGSGAGLGTAGGERGLPGLAPPPSPAWPRPPPRGSRTRHSWRAHWLSEVALKIPGQHPDHEAGHRAFAKSFLCNWR